MSVISINDRQFEPLIPASAISERVKEMAMAISHDYQGKNPLFLAVLNGAFILAADLMRELNFPNEISFVKVSSYRGTQSTEQVRELIGFTESLRDRHVILIEDIIDTGLTMSHILKQVWQEEPASVKIATLLFKRKALQYPIDADYTGFEIENRFVVGYGLDYDGQGRNLPHIYVEKG